MSPWGSDDLVWTFKVVVLGDSKSGKTALIKWHSSGEFVKEYVPTEGADVTPLVFNTRKGPIKFEVWDVSGLKGRADVRDAYFTQVDGVIILYDVTRPNTYDIGKMWLHGVSGKVPTVFCANKNEVETRNVREQLTKKFLKMKGQVGVKFSKDNQKHFSLSVKKTVNIELSFLWLAQKLTGDPELKFVAMPAKMAPQVRTNADWKRQMAKELQEAQQFPLPDDDEDDL